MIKYLVCFVLFSFLIGGVEKSNDEPIIYMKSDCDENFKVVIKNPSQNSYILLNIASPDVGFEKGMRRLYSRNGCLSYDLNDIVSPNMDVSYLRTSPILVEPKDSVVYYVQFKECEGVNKLYVSYLTVDSNREAKRIVRKGRGPMYWSEFYSWQKALVLSELI